MLTRRQWIASTATPVLAAAQSRPQRRNILLMVADDLGRSLRSYGDPNARTPNLDALAASGMRFENAFATTASCSPSRSVMLTGLFNHTNGQYGLAQADHNFHLKSNVRPASRTLKAAGYRTAVIGKFHVNPPSAFDWDLRAEGKTFDVDALSAATRGFISQDQSKPWYLHLGFGDPHRGPGARFNVERPTFDPNEIKVPSFLPDTKGTRQDLAEYYTAVERFDRGIGLVMNALKETGQLENTLVMVISDNGVPMPNAKTTLYDSGVRLPMIVRAPETRPGVVSQAMVSFVDLVPTFFDWAQLDSSASAKLPGRSVLPLLGQPGNADRDRVYLSHTFHGVPMYYPMRGVRTRRYKYIRNLFPELTFPHASDLYGSPTWQAFQQLPKGTTYGKRDIDSYLHRPAEELYDIHTDPDEVLNLATNPAHRATLETLRTDVAAFRKSTGDPWLAWELRR